MKGYNRYKDSGIEWIGEVPKEWNVRKLKYLAKIKNGKDQKEVLIEEGGYPVLGTGGEFGRASTFLYDKPSVLLGRKGTIDKPFYIEEPFWTVDTLFYTEIYENTLPKFLFYLTKTIRFEFYQESSAVPSMTQDNLNNIHLCHPSLEEQTQIVTFLDYKTNLIDSTIEKKKRLIELLKEKRQAIINEAVTKGLNPNAPMKASGVEWLGEIPEDWQVIKLKHIVDMRSGNFISAEIIEEVGTYPVYGGNGLRGFTSEYTHEGYFPLIGRQGALCGNINYASGRFWATEHAVVVSSKREINTYWIGELLRLMNLNQYSQASAQPGLSVEKILNLRIPLPNFEEQNLIANKLEDLNNKIELSESHLKNSIQKLQTYRQSLISEAVTGKIDVRDWQTYKN